MRIKWETIDLFKLFYFRERSSLFRKILPLRVLPLTNFMEGFFLFVMMFLYFFEILPFIYG